MQFPMACLLRIIFRKIHPQADERIMAKYGVIVFFYFINLLAITVAYSFIMEDRNEIFFSYIGFLVFDMLLVESLWVLLGIKVFKIKFVKAMVYLR